MRFRPEVVAVVLAVLLLALVLSLAGPGKDVEPGEMPRGDSGAKPSVDLSVDISADEGSQPIPEGAPEGAGESTSGEDSRGGGIDPDDGPGEDGESNEGGQQAVAGDAEGSTTSKGHGDANTGNEQDLEPNRYRPDNSLDHIP